MLDTDGEVDISTYTYFYGKIRQIRIQMSQSSPTSLTMHLHYLSFRLNISKFWEWEFLSANFPFEKFINKYKLNIFYN